MFFFLKPGPPPSPSSPQCARLAFGLSCEALAAERTSNSHTTKIREDPQKGRKKENCVFGGEGQKKREILTPPPFGSLSPPTPETPSSSPPPSPETLETPGGGGRRGGGLKGRSSKGEGVEVWVQRVGRERGRGGLKGVRVDPSSPPPLLLDETPEALPTGATGPRPDLFSATSPLDGVKLVISTSE